MDIINGLFESLAGFVILLSCWQILKKKQLEGVSLFHIIFFNAWGVWNIFYYPHLGQWVSFVGGLGVLAGNTLWLCLCIYYCRKQIADYFADILDRLIGIE